MGYQLQTIIPAISWLKGEPWLAANAKFLVDDSLSASTSLIGEHAAACKAACTLAQVNCIVYSSLVLVTSLGMCFLLTPPGQLLGSGQQDTPLHDTFYTSEKLQALWGKTGSSAKTLPLPTPNLTLETI